MSLQLNEYLENILTDLGGLGRFQFILTIVVLGSKATIAWSVLMMAFGGVIPDWTCTWVTESGTRYMPNSTFDQVCKIENITEELDCSTKIFDPAMNTIVSEFDLVCDKKWIMSTITTIQMFGLLVGAFVSGQVGDLYGRKPTYYASIVILLVFNVVGAFSVSWEMFAAIRFLVGIGCGWYLTIDIAYLAEFIPMKHRSMVLSLPMWPLGAITNGLMCYLLHDWMYVQIAAAVFCLPWFLAVRTIPESYRWLVSHKKIEDAYDVMVKVAQINRVDPPNKDKVLKRLSKLVQNVEKGRKYTVLDILKNTRLLKITLLLGFTWISCGYGFYAISFGVSQLSGNLYLNMSLLGLMESSSFFVCFLANRFGRKSTSVVFFLMSGIAGIVVGIIQFLELSDKGLVINILALASKLSVAAGWMPLIIFTSELYPTVVRNLGFGINNTLSRVGAMVAPQLIYASYDLPGIMFLLLGALFTISSCCILMLEETNKTALTNTICEVEISVERHNLLGNETDTKGAPTMEVQTLI